MRSNNDDLISRQAVIKAIRNHINVNRERADRGYAAMIRDEDIKIIEGVPSAERVGEWIIKTTPFGFEYTQCSNCETDFSFKTDRGTIAKMDMRESDYCPNCGARMKKTND